MRRPPDVTVEVRSTERRGDASVLDITYRVDATELETSPPVEAYLVLPADDPSAPGDGETPDVPGRAGVLFLHWFDTEAPDGDRTEFLAEAVTLAGRGCVSLLPQGTFPWHADPMDAASDAQRIRDEMARIRAGLELLRQQDGVDAGRVAVVGHDFGGMYAALLAGDEPRAAAFVLMAATPRWGDWFLPFWPVGGERWAYLRDMEQLDPIASIARAAPAPVLFQFARHDYFIPGMTGHEFQRAAGEPNELRAYDADHRLDDAAREDRLAFLERVLELPPG